MGGHGGRELVDEDMVAERDDVDDDDVSDGYDEEVIKRS